MKSVKIQGVPITRLEYLALGAIISCFKSKTFSELFRTHYRPAICQHLKREPDVKSLGPKLRDIFRSANARFSQDSEDVGAGADGRSQGEVSRAGSAWERLLSWYLSACLAGYQAYVVHRSARRLCLPAAVNEALKVTVGGKDLEDDNDVIVVVDRKHDESPFRLAAEPWHRTKGEGWPSDAGLREAAGQLQIDRLELIGIACKTNYNDSVNSGLFWHFIYSNWQDAAKHGRTADLDFQVGSANGKLSDLRRGYSLALATVPTQSDLGKFKATTAAVVKASLFSGGAYWGAPSTPFQKNIDHFFTKHDLEPPGERLGTRWVALRKNLPIDPWFTTPGEWPARSQAREQAAEAPHSQLGCTVAPQLFADDFP